MIMLDKIISTYKNNPIGAIGGALIGYYGAKQLGFDKTIAVTSFIIGGSLIGCSIEYMIKAKSSQPTKDLI